MDGFSISAGTRAVPKSDRPSDSGRVCRSHLHLQHPLLTAAIKPREEISGFRFHKANSETTDFMKLIG